MVIMAWFVDTAAVLRELGMDDTEIAALRESGIIG
jgi:crotonobetainyl-CoA:carnitine CoA-transferase CaiB-like acyl-CoA transferase